MELSIDTASELASIALSQEGKLVAESTWRCRRNHTAELLPQINRMLAEAAAEKGDLRAVCVCLGPGMYTGLRVGVSVSQGLARGLGLPALGVGRLELDAYPHASFPGPIIAIHQAGRGDLAWASYAGDPWREISAPQLSRPREIVAAIEGPTLFTGEVDVSLASALREAIGDRCVIAGGTAAVRRAGALAEIGYAHLSAGGKPDPALLQPIYLRPPAIGPQTPPP